MVIHLLPYSLTVEGRTQPRHFVPRPHTRTARVDLVVKNSPARVAFFVTDRQTDRQTDGQTPQEYRRGLNKDKSSFG